MSRFVSNSLRIICTVRVFKGFKLTNLLCFLVGVRLLMTVLFWWCFSLNNCFLEI